MSYEGKSVVWIIAWLSAFSIYCLLDTIPVAPILFILFGTCFVSELVDSSLGMGYGTMLAPLLLLLGFTPQEIIPNLLFSELFTGLSAGFFHHEAENIDISLNGKHFKIALLLIAGSVIGVLSGVHVALTIPENTMVILIGCIIFFSGFVVLVFYDKAVVYKNWKIVLLSVVASFNKSFSGGGYGPLVTSGQILSGIEGRASVGITSFSEGFTCLITVILLYFHGVTVNMTMLAPMLTGAMVSVPFSAYLVSKAKERNMKIIVGLITMFLGAYTLFQAIK